MHLLMVWVWLHTTSGLLSWQRWAGPFQSHQHLFLKPLLSSFVFSPSAVHAALGQITLKGQDPAKRAFPLPWLDQLGEGGRRAASSYRKRGLGARGLGFWLCD